MKRLCAKYTNIVTKHHNRFTELGMRNNLEITRGHILHMLQKIPTLDTHGKQNRWIGFVQGWLWSNGIRNLGEMREDIREVLDRDEKVDMPRALTKEESRDLMALMPTSSHEDRTIFDL